MAITGFPSRSLVTEPVGLSTETSVTTVGGAILIGATGPAARTSSGSPPAWVAVALARLKTVSKPVASVTTTSKSSVCVETGGTAKGPGQVSVVSVPGPR